MSISPGGVGPPIQIVTIQKEGKDWQAREMDERDWQNHLGFIADIEKKMSSLPSELLAARPAAAPPPQPISV
jgi:hypothetical protein